MNEFGCMSLAATETRFIAVRLTAHRYHFM
jgi:hypothetical protein